MRVLRESSEDEMVACFLRGELASPRFGSAVRTALLLQNRPEMLLTDPDLADEQANRTRRAVLATTRGFGEDRELFENFPSRVRWVWARLIPAEQARIRYMDYSYWIELSHGSRLPIDAARRIVAGQRAYDVSNQWMLEAADAVTRGQRLPPLILVGQRHDELVCLEGHLRLTAYALAGFPNDVECLVGIAPDMHHWTALPNPIQ